MKKNEFNFFERILFQIFQNILSGFSWFIIYIYIFFENKKKFINFIKVCEDFYEGGVIVIDF